MCCVLFEKQLILIFNFKQFWFHQNFHPESSLNVYYLTVSFYANFKPLTILKLGANLFKSHALNSQNNSPRSF